MELTYAPDSVRQDPPVVFEEFHAVGARLDEVGDEGEAQDAGA